MTRYRSVHVFSQAGYATEGSMEPVDDDRPMRYDWTGPGDGSGTLVCIGTDHYIGTWVNVVQHNPVFRYATRAVGVDVGQLDIGLVEEGGPLAADQDQGGGDVHPPARPHRRRLPT